MMRITIGYPDTVSEKSILQNSFNMDSVKSLEARLSQDQIVSLTEQIPEVHVASQVDEYILALVRATRNQPQIEVGVSPRGALALRRACQANALLENRDYVTPDDVKALAVAALAHRLIFAANQVSATPPEAERFIATILQSTPVPL
jgi:MoxR-like ATPase